MSQSSLFTLTVGGVKLDQQLQFTCLTLLLDNPTNQYIFIPQGNIWVPPNTHGRVIPMQGGQVLQASFLTPLGVAANILIPGQFATLTALDSAMPASAGGLGQPSASSGFLGRVKLPTVPGTSTYTTVKIPQGTQTLGLNVVSPPGSPPTYPFSIQVVGDQSNNKYFGIYSILQASFSGNLFEPVLALDLSVTIQFYFSGAVGTDADVHCELWAIQSNQAVVATQNPQDVWDVNVSAPLIPLPVIIQPAHPLSVVAFTVVLGAGTVQNLIPAPVSATITLTHIHFSVGVTTNASVYLEDTAGTLIGILSVQTAGSFPIPYYGFSVIYGRGIQFHNPWGVSANFGGHLLYTKA